MALPATGGSWAEVIEPGLNPLATNYWQTTDILICDYFKANGTVLNLADPSVGLGTQGLFTPFAADGITIREDLLITAPTPNMGFYHIGLLKENQASHTLDQTIQETPSAQYIRTVRNVITKLEDKIEFQPIENTPLIHYLRNELPLVNGIPALGTPGLQIPRPNTDVLQERVIVLLGTDGAGTLFAKVFAHVTTDKKGKTELGRHAPESSPFTYSALPCPFARNVMWTCFAGTTWLGAGDFEFETSAPQVTPVTGPAANVVFPTPIDIESPAYTITIQETAGSAFTTATLSGSASVSGAFTTQKISGLIASTTYNAVQVTATGSNATATSPASAPFTSTAS